MLNFRVVVRNRNYFLEEHSEALWFWGSLQRMPRRWNLIDPLEAGHWQNSQPRIWTKVFWFRLLKSEVLDKTLWQKCLELVSIRAHNCYWLFGGIRNSSWMIHHWRAATMSAFPGGPLSFAVAGCSRDLNGIYVQQPISFNHRPVFACAATKRHLEGGYYCLDVFGF